MSESAKKYPKAVKAIYIAGADGKEGKDVDVDPTGTDRSENVTKHFRDWNREVRAVSLAAGEFFKTYLEQHDASNQQTRDGAVKHFGKNTVKAHKAAFRVLKSNSKVFENDPSQLHDKVVEYMEDLEDEFEDGEE